MKAPTELAPEARRLVYANDLIALADRQLGEAYALEQQAISTRAQAQEVRTRAMELKGGAEWRQDEETYSCPTCGRHFTVATAVGIHTHPDDLIVVGGGVPPIEKPGARQRPAAYEYVCPNEHVWVR